MDFIQEGFTQAYTLLINRDPATYSAISVTLRTSGLAMAASLLLGVPLGYVLGYFDFSFKKQFRVIVDTLLSLPTVFIGLVIYALLTRNGPFGESGMLFTIPGIAIGQAILSLYFNPVPHITPLQQKTFENKRAMMALDRSP